MSGFFPFGMKMGHAPNLSPAGAGCPLEEHPFWTLVHGTAPGNMCWASSDGRSIRGDVDNPNFCNVAYKNQFRQDGTIGCIVEKVVTANGHYVLPIAGRMIDWDNFIGARTAQGKYEVIDKVGGSYHTLFSGGTPAVGDEMLLVLTGQYWKFIVNGSQLADGTTTLAEEEGWWGCSTHQVKDGDVLVSKITIIDASLAKTPCMTSDTTPYGVMSASSIFGPTYPAWKAMNCSSGGGTNCWISGDGEPMPQWIQWIGPPNKIGQPAMVPDLLHIEGRSINADHNNRRGPKKLTMLGTVDGFTWEEVQTWDDLDFGATRIMDLPVSGSNAFTGVRLRVDEIREAGKPTQIGTFTVHGHFGELKMQPVGWWMGSEIERTADAVYVKDSAQTGDSDDKAKLFSGAALEFVSGTINCGDIGQCETVCFTSFGTGQIIELAPGITISEDAGGIVTAGLSNVTIYGTDRFVVTFDAVAASAVILGGFSGQISNVQIWDAPFTPEDVAYDFENCHRGGVAYERNGSALTKANLKGWWPLIEGSGNIAFDWSGNANNGVLENFPTDDSQWISQLDSPMVLQTALMSWAMGTNLLPYADKFESDWTSDGGAISESGTRLDGRPAILFSETGTVDESHRIYNSSNTLLAGECRVKVRVKDAGRDLFGIMAYNDTDTRFIEVHFTFSTETFDIVHGDCSFTKLEDGWYEIEAWGTATIDGSNVYLGGINASTGIDGPAFYLDGAFANNGEIGACIVTGPAPATRALVPCAEWERNSNFFRTYGELNWNGRSYADAGNGADVNVRTALIVEAVLNNPLISLGKKCFPTGKGYCYVLNQHSENNRHYAGTFYFDGGSLTVTDSNSADIKVHHLLFCVDFVSKLLMLYVDGILKSTTDIPPEVVEIIQRDDELYLGSRFDNVLTNSDAGPAITGSPLTAIYKDQDAQDIIDAGMDAKALEMFARAKKFFPLGDIMPEPDLAKWTEVNVETIIENRGVRVRSLDDTNYSLHTWDDQIIPVEEGVTYVYRFWAQLGDYDVANYTTYDVTNGQFLDNVVDYSGQLNHDSMTMIDIEIVIPAGCTELAVSAFRGGDGPADVIFRRVQAIFKK